MNWPHQGHHSNSRNNVAERLQGRSSGIGGSTTTTTNRFFPDLLRPLSNNGSNNGSNPGGVGGGDDDDDTATEDGDGCYTSSSVGSDSTLVAGNANVVTSRTSKGNNDSSR